MKDQDFTTSFSVDQTPEEVFKAINNVRGWWSEEIEDVHRCKVKITEFIPGKKVAWFVLDNYFDFTEDKTEWKGTKINFRSF